MTRLFSIPVAIAAVAALASSAVAAAPKPPDPVAVGKTVDKLIAQENGQTKTRDAGVVNDLAFLRRVAVDMTGRIPTDAEIQKYLAWPADQRRAKAVDEFVSRDQFADRWAVFFGDLLRVRSQADGGAALQAFIHEAIRANVPYDYLARRLIAASGKANAQPETGFLLNDEADPMALTAVVSQVFMGVRISCAQCHNHPFDTWTREEFYDMAAFFGKTRRVEHRVKMRVLGIFLNEMPETQIMWPPVDKARGQKRTPVKPSFPFKLDEGDGPNQHLARLKVLREWQAAEAKRLADAKKTGGTSVDDLIDGANTSKTKTDEIDVIAEAKSDVRKIDLEGDLYKSSEQRRNLAEHVTNPRNRFFSRAIVNRVWGEMVGRGFVNPVDDFRGDNPATHPKTLDYLADEFVASGYDFRFLVKAIASTGVYQKGHLPATLPAPERQAAEAAFTATPPRRMLGESIFDSIVLAGHLFELKHRPGENQTTIITYVQVPVAVKDDPKNPGTKPKGPSMTAMGAKMMGGGYDLERGIELDFKDALKKRDGLDIDKMTAKSPEELEAEMMMKSGKMMEGKRVRYITKEVPKLVDDNPRFSSSMRMAAPAPAGHFVRVFGQTDRASLDDRRDHSPSMRQALMMLNGKLTNEAARVGPLEPMHALLVGDKANVDAAIKLAYREILTREPSPEEVTDAHTILKDAKTPLDGMADLRWALLNSNEFRYIP